MPDRLLIVEDSRVVAKVLARLLQGQLDVEVRIARTYAEAVLAVKDGPYLAALVDLNLPDAPSGAAVDLFTATGIPVVVVTGDLSDRVQSLMWSKQVADYFVKDELLDPAYLVGLISRFSRNRDIEVLVVDDSLVSRNYAVGLLKRHRYHVLQAPLPSAALGLVQAHPDLRLVITDFNMPEMDGCALTRALRKLRSREELAIIGVSAQGSAQVSARFIKSGANDFIHKPFTPDEFYCRVGQNISMLESIRAVRDSSQRDFLTGLYNRRYFYEVGTAAYQRALTSKAPLSVAMFDLDRFKLVNDTYGHQAGDAVLKALASLLKQHVQAQDIACRFGGEEFCLLAVGVDRNQLALRLEQLRAALEALPIVVGETTLQVTASFGANSELGDSLDQMLRVADECLYEAKHAGRNRVVMAGSSAPPSKEPG